MEREEVIAALGVYSVAEIARGAKVSRNTVYKYLLNLPVRDYIDARIRAWAGVVK